MLPNTRLRNCRIKWSINKWSQRFECQSSGPNAPQLSRVPVRQFLQELPPPPLPVSAWVLAAADFHCCNVIPRLLSAQQGNAMMPRSPEALKRLMWEFSSSVNTRRHPQGTAVQNEADRLRWEAIRVSVAKMQRSIVMENVSSACSGVSRAPSTA